MPGSDERPGVLIGQVERGDLIGLERVPLNAQARAREERSIERV